MGLASWRPRTGPRAKPGSFTPFSCMVYRIVYLITFLTPLLCLFLLCHYGAANPERPLVFPMSVPFNKSSMRPQSRSLIQEWRHSPGVKGSTGSPQNAHPAELNNDRLARDQYNLSRGVAETETQAWNRRTKYWLDRQTDVSPGVPQKGNKTRSSHRFTISCSSNPAPSHDRPPIKQRWNAILFTKP